MNLSPTASVDHRSPVAPPLTVAIMQPYFLPYAGYFRLFAASDLFVIYDCVQFPRRGWVHRNRVIDPTGVERWLTLPLRKAPQDVLIRELSFVADAPAVLEERLRPFSLSQIGPNDIHRIVVSLHEVRGSPVDYIERLLRDVAGYLGLRWNVMRSSELGLPASLHGQSRIIEIAQRLGARRYVNAPGGRDLYEPAGFADAGIELCFLPEYPGPKTSILSRLIAESSDTLSRDIKATID